MTTPLTKILCIDDEQDILALTVMCLESMGGYQVAGCSNGREGIAKAKEFRPDLITVDMMMPDMDGRMVLAALKADPELAGIPVVFMTAKAQDSDIANYKNAGAAGVLPKPFDPMAISAEIQKIWDAL